MKEIKIDGMGTLMEGTYGQIKIDGMGKITGDIEFDSLKINGACKAVGNLIGKEIKINGDLKAQKDIRVKKIIINGAVSNESGKLFADEIHVDGVLSNENEVNADRIVIHGSVSLHEVYGDKIYMNPVTDRFHFFRNNKNRNHAKTIECSYLEAVNLYCDTICATDIHLSSNCKIEHITCDGKLVYDSSCKIGTIEGDCEIIVE